jgi:hypothetical protein
MPSGSRLVAIRCTFGHRCKIVSAVLAHAAIRCSQLSSTISMSCGPSASASVSRAGRPGCAGIPSAPAMAAATASGSVTAASSASHTPSPDPSSSSAATCKPRRVFPAPPGPVKVTRRQDPTKPRTSDSSRSRPMNVASCAGRLFASAGLPSERSGGNPAARPGALTWKIRSGRPRSFSWWVPRSISAAPGGSASRTRAAAVSETSTWPPCPTAATRAARCTSRPTGPAAVSDASPVCTPIRTRTRSPAGQAWPARACCICTTAATHARGEANAAKKPSPAVFSSRPPCAASTDRISA